MRIGVVGAGLAGLSAARSALELGADVEVFESAGAVGGLASSVRAGGLTFDLGPHTLYPADVAMVQDIEMLSGAGLRRISPAVASGEAVACTASRSILGTSRTSRERGPQYVRC